MKPASRLHRTGLRTVVALSTVAALASGMAWAYWSVSSVAGGNGASAATVVSQGATPTAVASGYAVTVSWAATTLATGQAVSGYRIIRYSGVTAQTITSACTGTVAATTCVESAVPAGTWTYTVTPAFATNWLGAESAKSAAVTVANQAPVAVANSYSVNEDASLTVAAAGVLTNDTDSDGDPLTAVLLSGVANGSLTFNANGGFTYVPGATFNGSDSFTYKANDGVRDSNTVTVTLTVTGVNDLPVNSVPGAQQTPKNTTRVFSAATNNAISISDIDAGAATVQVRLTATNGTVTLPVLTGLTFSVGDGTSDTTMTFTGTMANINLRLDGATFIPTNNYTGSGAALEILTSDLGNTGTGGTLTDTDSVTVNVNSLGIFTANQDIGIPPGTTGSSSYTTGTYTVAGSGADIWGSADNLQYLYRSMTGDGRLTAKIVSDVQTPTASSAAKASVMFRESVAAGSVHGMMNVMESAGSEFLWRTTTDGATGGNGTGGPAAPYWVRITRVGHLVTAERSVDGTTWVQQATQTITMASTILVGLGVTAHDSTKLSTVTYDNVALTTTPTAVADSYSVNEDTTLNVAARGVLANDTDPESNALTAVLVSGTTGLTLNANGSFAYLPPAGFSGAASFTYKANDGVFDSNTVTVNLTVNPANEVPSFTAGADQSVAQGAGAQTVAGWATAISQGVGESGQLVDFIVTNTNNALFSVQPAVSATGTLTYTPNGSAPGAVTVSVRIHDNGGTANGGTDTSAIQTFTITLVAGAANAYYAFNAGSGTTAVDSTGNGHTATLQAGAGWTTGKVGTNALNVTGAANSFATAPNPVINTSTSYTVAAWVKLNSVTGFQTFASLDGVNISPFYLQLAWDGRLTFTLRHADNVGSATTNVAGVSPTIGIWYHVAGVFNQPAGTIELYVNGVSQGVGTGAVGFQALGSTNIGRARYAGPTDYVNGAIDEVRFYSRVLTSGEVNLLGTDVTGPTGGSLTPTGLVGTGAQYSTSTTVNLSLVKGADPAGIAASGNLLLRATATLLNGACGAYGGYAVTTGGNDPGATVADTVTAGACYAYRYVVSDSVGNPTTYTSGDIKVDTTAPTTPSLAFSSYTNTYWPGSGSTVYYRSAAASGSVTATATATDTVSGIASYAFPALGTNWTSTPGALGVNTYAWSAAPAAPGTTNVTATNNAALTSANAPFTSTDDSTAPSAGTVTPPNATQASTTVSVAYTTGTDGGSGLGTRLLQRQFATLAGSTCGSYTSGWATASTNPSSSPFADVVTTGFCYQYRYVVSDNVGNLHTATSANVVTVTAGLSYTATVSGETGLLNYFRLGEATTSRDSMTGTAGVTLQSRSGETAASWTKHPASQDDAVLTPAGRVRKANVSVSALYYTSATPASADYTVEADLYVASTLTGDMAGLVGRVDTGNTLGTFYYVRYEQGSLSWSMFSLINNGWSYLGGAGQTLTVGSTYRVALAMSGTSIKLIVDGVEKISVTDSSITAAGRGGFMLGSGGTTTDTDTTGYHLDNFQITPPVADSKGTNHGRFSGGVTLGATGAITGDANTAVQLDGSNDCGVVARTIQDDFTVELWFKSTSGLGTGNTQWWQGQGLLDADLPGSANDFGISLGADGRVVAGVGKLSVGDVSVVSGTGFANGAWHHVVFTRTKATGLMELYVDKVSRGTATNNANVSLDASTIISLGKTQATGYLNGWLDEVALYTTVLTPAQVVAHYDAAQ